jgi:UPF0755 protein
MADDKGSDSLGTPVPVEPVAVPYPPSEPPRDLAPVAPSADSPKKARGFLSRAVLRSPAAAIHPETVPVPPEPEEKERPERPMVNFISGLLSFVLIVLAGVAAMVVIGQQEIVAPGPLQADKVVIVHGSTADVIDQLEREEVINRSFLLALYWQLTGKGSQIKGGEYLFKKEVSLEQLTATLIEGKSILHAVTIPEGKTSYEIIDILKASTDLSGDVKDIPREGSLLPETYKFARGMTRTQLLDHMAQDQSKLVRDIWAKRAPDLPLSSPQDLVTLAAMVEKETGKADERPRVAAVFINRLRLKMRLESDPTVTYGIVGSRNNLGRPLSKADLAQPSPYNTYLLPGLPAGPITNPGRAALEAVANPSQTKELYFVADGTGGHVFAETLEQHNKNVARYRQIEADRAADSAAGAKAAGPQTPGTQPGPGAQPQTATTPDKTKPSKPLPRKKAPAGGNEGDAPIAD